MYITPELTDQDYFDFHCHGLFVVLREKLSASESLVYTPKCSVAEGSDGTLIIHNDLSAASQRDIKTSLSNWDHNQVSRGT